MQALPLSLVSSLELEALVTALSSTPFTLPASIHTSSTDGGSVDQQHQHAHRQQQQQQLQQRLGAGDSWGVQLLRGFLTLQRFITQVSVLPLSRWGVTALGH